MAWVANPWQYRECNFPAPGLQAWPSTYGKAIFNVEYKLAASKFCPQANSSSYNFNSILKDVNLYDVPTPPAADRTGHSCERNATERTFGRVSCANQPIAAAVQIGGSGAPMAGLSCHPP